MAKFRNGSIKLKDTQRTYYGDNDEHSVYGDSSELYLDDVAWSTVSGSAADIAAVDAKVDTTSGTLQTQIDTNATGISDNTTLIATTSGVLSDQIIESANNASTTYYLHEDSADIGGYELLRSTPSDGAEDTDTLAIDIGDGETAMDMYITVSGEPNTTSIPPGTYTWISWASISSIVTGPHYLRAKWYRREQSGTQHYLFTQEHEITSTVPIRYVVETSTSGIDMAVTDRLEVQIFAQTAAGTNRTFTYYVEGINRASRFNTPVYTSLISNHGDLTGLTSDDHLQYHTDARGDARYYTETELDAGQLDNRYYTETEADVITDANTALIATTSGTLASDLTTHASSADHDGRYYTESEVDALTWTESDIVDLDKYTQAEVTTISGDIRTDVSAEIDGDITTHAASADHDGRYYTETEADVITDANTALIATTSGTLQTQIDAEAVISGTSTIASGVDSTTVTFSEPYILGYNVTTTLANTVDVSPTVLAHMITDIDEQGFDVSLSASTDSANYFLNWHLFGGIGSSPFVGITNDIEPDTVNADNRDVTYTFTWSESVTGFATGDIDVTGGSKGSFSPVSPTVYTQVVTADDDSNDDITVDIAAGVCQDSASNDNLEADQHVQAVDTVLPTCDSVVLSNYAMKVGDTPTLTITMSEAAINFTNTDVTLENGTLTPIESADGGITWTGVFTPTDDIEDNSNVIQVGTAWTDLAGNAPLSVNTSANYTIDTKEPIIESVVMSDSALKVGDTSTLTITFSEAVTNFTNDDITAPNGALTDISSGDGGVTWSNTFTPTDDIEDATNVISVGTSMTDIAGNAPLSGNTSANYAIDTKEPVCESVVLSSYAFLEGDTALLTITFSEMVTDFENPDITVENGGITAIQTADGGIIWTATFTPTEDVEDNTNLIGVGTQYTDLAGNAPLAGNTSSNYQIDTRHYNVPPTCNATGENPTFTEGGAEVELYSAVTIDTIEGGETIEEIKFTVTNVTDGVDEIIEIDGENVALTDANSGTTAANSYGYSVSLAGPNATVTLTTTGTSEANAQTLVDGLAYENTATPPETSDRVATLTSIKDSGGTAGDGEDTTVLSIASTVTVNTA